MKNPFLNATLPEHQEKERMVLEPEQVLKVLDFTCRLDYYDYYTMYCAILIAIACTMRGGEIGGLQWDHVLGDKGLISVDRVIDRVDKKNMDKLSKMEVLFKFPNLYPGCKTMIVLKQPKTRGSIRDTELPPSVYHALLVLREMQDKLKEELGPEGYMDYGLVICQANGRPIMTEHLNKRFKDILEEMNDPEMDPEEIVFHSLRHTSATTKLILSRGDYNSVKHAGGWANLEMLTRKYGNHSFAASRASVSSKMDTFLVKKTLDVQDDEIGEEETAEEALLALAQSNPELLIKIAKSIQTS